MRHPSSHPSHCRLSNHPSPCLAAQHSIVAADSIISITAPPLVLVAEEVSSTTRYTNASSKYPNVALVPLRHSDGDRAHPGCRRVNSPAAYPSQPPASAITMSVDRFDIVLPPSSKTRAWPLTTLMPPRSDAVELLCPLLFYSALLKASRHLDSSTFCFQSRDGEQALSHLFYNNQPKIKQAICVLDTKVLLGDKRINGQPVQAQL